jgi:hypothetical protein
MPHKNATSCERCKAKALNSKKFADDKKVKVKNRNLLKIRYTPDTLKNLNSLKE